METLYLQYKFKYQKDFQKEQREILLQLAKTMNEQPPVKKRKDYLANKFGGRLKTPLQLKQNYVGAILIARYTLKIFL